MGEDGLRARVVRLDYLASRHHPGARVIVEIDATTASPRIVDAFLAKPGDPLCEGGARASTITMERARASLDFEREWATLTGGRTRLDMSIGDGAASRCLTLEVTSPDADEAWRFETLFAAGFGVAIDAHSHEVSGSNLGVQTYLLAGDWVGPVRIMAGPGLGADVCHSCPRAPSGERRDSSGLSFRLHADAFPVQSGALLLGVGARYSLVVSEQPRGNDDATTTVAYHVISVAPLFGLADLQHDAPQVGIPGGPKTGTLALEMPIGIATPLNDYRRPALSLGVGFSAVF